MFRKFRCSRVLNLHTITGHGAGLGKTKICGKQNDYGLQTEWTLLQLVLEPSSK